MNPMDKSPKLKVYSLMIDIFEGLRASTHFLCICALRKMANRTILSAVTVII